MTQVGDVVTLTAVAGDDGRPGPQLGRLSRPQRGYDPLPNDLPTIGGRRSGAASGGGGPTDQNMVKVRAAYETGLAVTWLHYRGPGRVTFSESVSSAALVDGRVSTSVSFTEPGAFVIRAAADDGSFVSSTDVTVRVEAMDPDLAR